MKLSLTEQMTIADKFSLVSDHPWRAQYYELDNSRAPGNIDDYGLVMVEMLQGKYDVCRIERFVIPAHESGFQPGVINPESVDYQPKYYGTFSHNQLLQAFVKALQVSTTDLTTNTLEV